MGLVAAAALVSEPAAGDPAHDVASAFYVSKSENRNQVHYAVRLDEQCAPAAAAPVLPYWRMLERDAHATEPLLQREVPAYGIAEQSVVSRGERGGVVRVVLRALPSRPLLVSGRALSDGHTVSERIVP